MIPITGYEYKNRSNEFIQTIDFFLTLEKHNNETWAYLCDKYGRRYVYSICVTSEEYHDGWLDNDDNRDWLACMGCETYNRIIIKREDLNNAIFEAMKGEDNVTI